MTEPRSALRRTFGETMLRRSLGVALVIGTLLNAINQGPELLAGQAPVIWKLLLTYAVPFCVASFSGYAALRDS